MFRTDFRPPSAFNFLCEECLESSSVAYILVFTKSSYKTIRQDIDVNDLFLRPERMRAKVLGSRRMASPDAHVYTILKMGQSVSDLTNSHFEFYIERHTLWGSEQMRVPSFKANLKISIFRVLKRVSNLRQNSECLL